MSIASLSNVISSVLAPLGGGPEGESEDVTRFAETAVNVAEQFMPVIGEVLGSIFQAFSGGQSAQPGNGRSPFLPVPTGADEPAERDRTQQRAVQTVSYSSPFASPTRPQGAVIPQPRVPSTPSTTTSTPSTTSAPNRGNGMAAVVPGGKFIGGPHAGTHTLGNWESDNAIDIGSPEGTPIYAPANGTIERVSGNNDDPSSRFNGFKFVLRTDDGQRFYLTHLSAIDVKDGQRVAKGDPVGKVGSANGVSHLHMAQEHGNPESDFPH